MHDAPRAKLSDEEREQGAEQGIMELEEIAGPDLPSVILKECCPGLTMRTWWPSLLYVPLNCSLRDLDVDFEQLAADSLGTP